MGCYFEVLGNIIFAEKTKEEKIKKILNQLNSEYGIDFEAENNQKKNFRLSVYEHFGYGFDSELLNSCMENSKYLDSFEFTIVTDEGDNQYAFWKKGDDSPTCLDGRTCYSIEDAFEVFNVDTKTMRSFLDYLDECSEKGIKPIRYEDFVIKHKKKNI